MNSISKIKIFSVLLFLFSAVYFLGHVIYAATNIDPQIKWAWNDVIGWIDFNSTDNVNVTSSELIGYADSSVGYIALNCNSTPNGNICGTSNFKVSHNGNGYLSGWAWNDSIGWISFDSGTSGSSYTYQVTFNTSNGKFSGWAWNDIIGWISFSCDNTGACPSSNYEVKTNWSTPSVSAELISSIFDTKIIGGVSINTIMWQGNQPLGTSVKFQITSSNSENGPWDYKGPDGSSSTYYATSVSIPIKINLSYHNNHRYLRYKIILESDSGRTAAPRVDDIIINWSP